MKSILAIVDKPGWSVDNQVSQVMRGLDQFAWEKAFHGDPDIPELIAKHDLIWCSNHGTGPRYWQVIKSASHPRVLATFRSWRYSERAIPFVTSGLVKSCSAISQELTSHVGGFFTGTRYIPDAVPDFFKPSRPRRIGFVGEPKEYKGFDMIAQAVSNCGFEFFVAPRLTDPRIGINIPQTLMPNFYESCDAIVVASEREGGGSIAMEAMAMNVPVLTTRVGTAADLDCLYIKRSVEGIEAGLRRLFGRSKVFPEFSVDAVNAKYAELFEDMLR